ncbi:MAG: enoyl-CoA hydratase/carnithine racemase [Parasphingorhabdus sp.]
MDADTAFDLALKLARKIASNASLSNYIMIQAISRIEDMAKADGLFTESLCAALTQTSPDSKEGLQAFLDKRPQSFR